MIISIHVTPRSSKNELIKISDNTFRAKVTAPPEKGKANETVIELLADHFNTSKSKIKLKAGSTSREKLFIIDL